MVFDILCYGIAIATTLAFFGSAKCSEKRVRRTVEAAKQAIATVDALDLTLPQDCFAVDVEEASEGMFDCGDNATFFEALAVAEGCAMVNRYWNKPTVTDNVVPFKRPVQPVAIKSVSYKNRDELRSHCWSILGVAYDSVGGKRKFWTVTRMAEELRLAGYEVVKAA